MVVKVNNYPGITVFCSHAHVGMVRLAETRIHDHTIVKSIPLAFSAESIIYTAFIRIHVYMLPSVSK